jgi:orotate phosphoribosyltransferase
MVPAIARRGHFIYESGAHGDLWLDLDRLFTDPARLQDAAVQLALRLRPLQADLVCGPETGGAVIGAAVAHALPIGFVRAERQLVAGGAPRYLIPQALRQLVAGKRILIVDDAINAGSATLACHREIVALGGQVAGVASVIIREGAVAELHDRLGVPIEALEVLPWHIWAPEACPRCKPSGPARHPTGNPSSG